MRETFPEWVDKIPRLSVPPNLAFGELSSSIAHEIARAKNTSPREVAQSICKAAIIRGPLISTIGDVAGYVNFGLDYEKASPIILESVLKETEHYGFEITKEPRMVAVEHTSANPSGPLTMGHARNSILGDALARLLAARGHTVIRRFYVDDVGRQVSILAYGFRLLGEPTPHGKPDAWLGKLYASTNCAVQIESLKKKLSTTLNSDDEREKLQRELDDWIGVAEELQSTNSDQFAKIIEAVQKRPDPELDIQHLGRDYEENVQEVTVLVRKVAQMALNGIRASLTDMEIEFDSWDWESQLIWENKVKHVIDRILKLPFTKTEGSSITLEVNSIVEEYSLRAQFHLASNYEVPPLTLVRSDGTTLYPTRDIAYTLLKFTESDKVINVIASEQSLPQLQIRLALYAMGEKNAATNLIHFAYGLVELPGTKMSKRRARFIGLNDVIEQARQKVHETIASRKEHMTPEEAEQISKIIALGAVKFAMLNISSVKNLTFTWDRVLSLERNSAPFINYAYTRAGSILRKLDAKPERYDLSALNHPLEKLLMFKIAQMPTTFSEAADQLKPEALASYANALAEKFHEYYEKVDVIHAEESTRNARAMLVKSVQIVLRNSMKPLGITMSERM